MRVWLWDISYEEQVCMSGAAVSLDAARRASEATMLDLWQDETVEVTWEGEMSGRVEEHVISIKAYELDV